MLLSLFYLTISRKLGWISSTAHFLKLEGQLTKPEARCIREMTTGILKTGKAQDYFKADFLPEPDIFSKHHLVPVSNRGIPPDQEK